MTLTAKKFWLSLEGMENTAKPALKRLNVSLTSEAVDDIEQLRSALEQRLKQRLSIAQVIKRLTKEALASELSR